MCIISLQFDPQGDTPLIVLANRDEFYARASLQAHYWDEQPTIFGGRDVERGGSWLALTNNGRFAAVTNYRDFTLEPVGEKSRGDLVSHFISSDITAEDYMAAIQAVRLDYGPMNLLVYDGKKLIHFNNIDNRINELQAGIHGLSNASINTPWPKVERMKQLFQNAVNEERLTVEKLLPIGLDTVRPVDECLPNTGIGLEGERELSSIFVKRDGYGTRNTTALIMKRDGSINFAEQTYDEGMIDAIIHEKISQ
ncbi:NRDE family protein [Kurthia sibirica]|nr:NRDE family protein [Kurthia sibirica]GEK34897.1 hypothetical protein KSI01_24300 [Kurthia sibirica]